MSHLHQESEPDDPVHRDPPLSELPINFWTVGRLPALWLIRFYQMTISKALPSDTCRFYPSCSHYGYTAVYRFGMIRGGLMAIWRILRCNPFNPGGIDYVPENKPAKGIFRNWLSKSQVISRR